MHSWPEKKAIQTKVGPQSAQYDQDGWPGSGQADVRNSREQSDRSPLVCPSINTWSAKTWHLGDGAKISGAINQSLLQEAA